MELLKRRPKVLSALLLPFAVLSGIVECNYSPGPLLTNVTTTRIGSVSTCYTGEVSVSINALATNFNIRKDLSQAEVTEVLQEFVTVNSTFVERKTEGTYLVANDFGVAVQLCVPLVPSPKTSVVQVLSHGLGLGKEYWNTALPNNSYIAAANSAGYCTLAYDRLGVGASQKPDPVNVVQFKTHVEILHGLSQRLRSQGIASSAFSNVIGIGHSVGSLVQLGAAARYPDDFDAIVITGYSDTQEYLGDTGFSSTPARAKDQPTGTYSTLPGAYVIDPSPIGFQLAFFHYPDFRASVFDAAYANRGIYTVGELLTLSTLFEPAATYTRPVITLDGENDITFCLGNCSDPYDRASAFLTSFFPAADPAKSATYLIPNTGHLINDHVNAPLAFEYMLQFVDDAI